MVGRTQRPLTLSEAKANLRAAAAGSSPSGWIRRNPNTALVSAVVAGIILGSAPHLRRNISRLVMAAAPLLITRR